MSVLVLEMRAGDMMVVNGAPLRFRQRTQVELSGRARFLFGKQLMRPEEVTTPAREIYFALQVAYVGLEDQRPSALEAARSLVGRFVARGREDEARQVLQQALASAESGDNYAALKLVRRVIALDDAPAEPSAAITARS